MKDVRAQIEQLLAERILVLDGAWGVLIHRRGLSEAEYRGERFRDHHKDVQGDPDLLNLTHPEIVAEIHDAYFAAGADIATTNTFTATRIGQADYDLAGRSCRDEPRRRAARPARGRRVDEAYAREAALRRRLARPAERHALALSACRGRRVPSGDLRSGARDVRGAGRCSARRRRRPAHGRDDLRHAQRQGGDRRGASASRPSSRSGSRSPPWTGAGATCPARRRTRSGSRSSTRSRSSSE